jgi:phosphoglycolate phosphatase
VLDAPLAKYLLPDGGTGAGERRVRVVAKDHPDAMRAVTLVRALATLSLPGDATPMSLLAVTIKTGRTHQIRVHLASAGHPIAGDDKYGESERRRALQKLGLKRMFLHAWRLQFNHPATGERAARAALADAARRARRDGAPPHAHDPMTEPLANDRPPRFDLIAFDWDGTLYDSTRLIVRCIQAAVVDVGGAKPSEDDAAWVIGLGLAEALARAAPDVPKEKYPELGARYRYHYLQHQDDIVLFDGVLPMLDALRARGHKLAVATGKSRRGLNEALKTVALRDRFDASRTADETFGKPHPRMLLELMEELEVPAERTLMIGDTTHDLQLAVNAGCAGVGVSYGAHEPDSFAEFKPLHIAHSIADLRDWLLRNA